MVENAAPSSTVRPSRRRAPATVRIAEAIVAAVAAAATSAKWTIGPAATGSARAHSMTAPGRTASAATAAINGSDRSSVPNVTSR